MRPHRLIRSIAGNLGEGLIDPQDYPGSIANDRGFLGFHGNGSHMQIDFRLLALGDILVNPQDADDLLVFAFQRNFRGPHPGDGAIRSGDRFVVKQFGRPQFHHRPIIAAEHFGMFGPRHVEIVVTDHVGGTGFARIHGKSRIASQIAQIAILPEHPDGSGIDDGLQQEL